MSSCKNTKVQKRTKPEWQKENESSCLRARGLGCAKGSCFGHPSCQLFSTKLRSMTIALKAKRGNRGTGSLSHFLPAVLRTFFLFPSIPNPQVFLLPLHLTTCLCGWLSFLVSALSSAWVLLSCGTAHFFLKHVSFPLSATYFHLDLSSVLLHFPNHSLPWDRHRRRHLAK